MGLSLQGTRLDERAYLSFCCVHILSLCIFCIELQLHKCLHAIFSLSILVDFEDDFPPDIWMAEVTVLDHHAVDEFDGTDYYI